MINKQKYILTIRLDIEAIDDIEARSIASKKISDCANLDLSNISFKLQEVFPKSPPRNVIFETKEGEKS